MDARALSKHVEKKLNATKVCRLALLEIWLCLLASWAGGQFWLFDLFSHFYVQYALVTFVTSLGFLWLYAWRFAWMSIATLAVLAFAIGSSYIPRSITSSDNAEVRRVRIVSCNVLTKNTNKESVLKFLRETKPDVALFMEVDQAWADALQPLLSEFPFHRFVAREDNFGIALLSTSKFKEINVREFDASGVPSIVAVVDFDDCQLRVIGTHPLPPIGSERSNRRNQHLAQLAELVKDSVLPTVVVGDLNCTPWSPHFRRLLQRAKLADSRLGFGIQATWPTDILPLRIPIDHALVSPEIGVFHRFVGPHIGSDHFPIVVDIQVPMKK